MAPVVIAEQTIGTERRIRVSPEVKPFWPPPVQSCRSAKRDMGARFKADATFTISRRGLVVAGEILDGTVNIGMVTQVPSWPSALTISGVELICRADKHPANVGLLFASQDEAEYARWRSLDLRGQVLEIQERHVTKPKG